MYVQASLRYKILKVDERSCFFLSDQRYLLIVILQYAKSATIN